MRQSTSTPIPGSVPTTTQRGTIATIVFLAIAFFAVLLVWHSGVIGSLLYPIRLFVTLIHEAGHGLTAILTGGRFVHFQVFPDGSGLAYTAGGSRFLIPQMGYLGAAAFGAVLLIVSNRIKNVRRVAYGVALLVGAIAILFTANGVGVLMLFVGGMISFIIASATYRMRALFQILAIGLVVAALIIASSETALFVGIMSAAVLALVATVFPRGVTLGLLNFLGLIVGLDVLLDIWSLMSFPGASLGYIPNDAAAIAQSTGLPTQFWVLLWAVLALVMNGFAIYESFIATRRVEPVAPIV